jgi:CRP/FNR family cyclic AMP-dependent transcriptional regulator
MNTTRIPYHKSESRSFKAGQPIFTQGDSGDTMYVVVEGSVDLLVNGQLVERLAPGGVLEAAPRSATAVARTDCKLVPVNQQRFSLLIQHTPDFALEIMRVMAGRLRVMDSRVQPTARSA